MTSQLRIKQILGYRSLLKKYEEQFMTKVKKIVIVGTSGSGKTCLGKKLSQISGLPQTDLDEIFWLPGWIESDRRELEQKISEKVNSDEWIISGNYNRVSDVIWQKANMMIWLDYPLLKIFWRCLKRSFRRIVTREICCNGNYETIKMLFSSKSILLWVLKTYRKRKKTYSKFFQDHNDSQIQLVRITNALDEKKFLDSLE